MSNEPNKSDNGDKEAAQAQIFPIVIDNPKLNKELNRNSKITNTILALTLLNLALGGITFSINYGNQYQIYKKTVKSQSINDKIVEVVCSAAAEQAAQTAVEGVKADISDVKAGIDEAKAENAQSSNAALNKLHQADQKAQLRKK